MSTQVDLLAEAAEASQAYVSSREAYERTIFRAYEAGHGPTQISQAVGILTEGGVRMLVKRLRMRAEVRGE